jgi:hypothetical protein
MGSTVPDTIKQANEVIERVTAFRMQWSGSMSKKTDTLSIAVLDIIRGLITYSHERYSAGYRKGREDAIKDARITFEPQPFQGEER